MTSEPNRYQLVVRPGIFKDGTFGVYAVPENNTAVEYQLDARFASINEAKEMAEAYLQDADQAVVVVARTDEKGNWIKEPPPFDRRFVTDQVSIKTEREVHLETSVTGLTEEKQEATLKANLKKMLQMPTSFRIAPFAKITETTPYWLSIGCLIILGFSLSVTIPTYIPLLGDVIGGKTLGRSQIARWFPFVLLASIIFLQFRVRGRGLVYSAIRDNVLSLALQHGWRRDRFSGLFLDTMESENLGWARKIGEWLHKWDPDTLRQVAEDAKNKQGHSSSEGSPEVIDVVRLVDEDFEARIHALYYIENEHGFRPWTVIIHPLLFLMTHRRAVRRLRALGSYGLEGLLYLGKCSLPGGDDYRVRRRFFPILALWPFLMFGIPLVWTFALRPWPTVFGIIGMVLLMAATVMPIVLWNYKLMIECRGLPRAMSWEEIQGDLKLIRGL